MTRSGAVTEADRFLGRFVAWAERENDVRGALLVGSRARQTEPADEWSDLDVVVVTRDVERLVHGDWIHELGDVWISFTEPTPIGAFIERRVLFEGAVDVDFVPMTASSVREVGGMPDIAGALRRGHRILLDKDGLLTDLHVRAPSEDSTPLPAAEEFANVVGNFWYHAVWTVKKLRRGEVWVAKAACDAHMKQLLLQLLRWHAWAIHGPSYDTWHEARFLERWAEPETVAALRATFAHYDRDDVARALEATMDLFRALAVETAERLGYAYPSSGDRRVTAWVSATVRPQDR